MSGGVDSSVAAALLRDAGHEVRGVTMRLFDPAEHVEAARQAAAALGIPLDVAPAEEPFARAVVGPFVDEYLSGLTPNPFAVCNARVKFGWLIERARAAGAKLATGHYARVEERDGRLALCAAPHARDQSYFLHGLSQEALRDVLFPVGGIDKSAVRAIARTLRLPAAERPESREICFVRDGDCAGFVAARAPSRVRAGDVVSTGGEVLARHGGLHRFTVGQRRGLGLRGGPARYVVRLEAEGARVVVGSAEEASREAFEVGEVSWMSGSPPPGPLQALVRVRYRHAGVLGTVMPDGGGARVALGTSVRGVAPGQAAVFYRGDEVLGGGRIVGA